jgi:hypothetical protein
MSAEPDYRRALTIGTFALIRVSEACAETSASPPSDLFAFGDTLQGFDCQMWEIHMVFYGVGHSPRPLEMAPKRQTVGASVSR